MSSQRTASHGAQEDGLSRLFEHSAGRLDAQARDRLLETAQEADLLAVFADSAAQLDDVTRARLERNARQLGAAQRRRRWLLRGAAALAASVLAVLAVRAGWQADQLVITATSRADARRIAVPAAAPQAMPAASATDRAVVTSVAEAAAAAESAATGAALGLVALHGEEDQALDGLELLEL